MDKDTLVKITISRKAGQIVYNVDCAKEVTSEELAHYLNEVIKGICTWKPEVCDEAVNHWSNC